MADLDHYDYDLPKELIAQTPLTHRADARLLVVDRATQDMRHAHVRDLPEILLPGDCMVFNDTKVVPARLIGRRTATGGRWEGLYVDATPEGLWRVLCKTRGKPALGETITLINAAGDDDLRLRLGVRDAQGMWIVRPESHEPASAILQRVGRVPLPPYIRKGEMVETDRQTYQTVYARNPGAVAAPTAGLHFTEPLLRKLDAMGVHPAWLTLHVGLGTFRPMTAPTLAEHRMHEEWASIGQETVDCIVECRARGGRVVAVGTTSVRTLETAAAGGTLAPFEGWSGLFIRPPYRFQVVDALLTNFHLPRSTLLVLVRTFGGDALIRRAYREAVEQGYRFYSYGDAMLIL
jgi:S-adenosylmethionine:tRNA ribosyltransferase-isomerase